MSDRARDALTFDYYDLSKDDAAWSFTMLDEDDEVELRHAGFRPLGVYRAVLRAAARRKLTGQIWVSADRRVTAAGDELGTLFEDGTIVKTNRTPSWPFFDQAWWRLRSHPKDRRAYTFVDGPFRARLAAHLEQVTRFEKESPVVVVDSMTPYFAMRLREGELRVARQRPEELLIVWVTVAMSFVAMMATTLALRMRMPERHPRPMSEVVPLTVLGLLAFLITAMAVGKVMGTWVAPSLVRLRPGPPPRPAATFMELARKVPTGTLEGT